MEWNKAFARRQIVLLGYFHHNEFALECQCVFSDFCARSAFENQMSIAFLTIPPYIAIFSACTVLFVGNVNSDVTKVSYHWDRWHAEQPHLLYECGWLYVPAGSLKTDSITRSEQAGEYRQRVMCPSEMK